MARIPGLTVGDKDLPKILKIAHEGTKGPLVIHLVIKEKGMSISMLSNGLNRIKKALPSNVKTIIYVHIPDL
jgi:hypothetical protein